ncbi:MAG: hypothetical protein SFV24_21715 [Gemmatimonadales bacterium]|nr:hypothetical protein [Gemmatimonadales bacterium]
MQPPVPPTPPAPPEIFVQAGPPPEVLIAGVVIVGIIVSGIILLPLIRAWARRLEGRSGDPALAAEVDHLRTRVAELEGIHHRVAELEERVDFSERLLAQGRESQTVERKRP